MSPVCDKHAVVVWRYVCLLEFDLLQLVAISNNEACQRVRVDFDALKSVALCEYELSNIHGNAQARCELGTNNFDLTHLETWRSGLK